MRPQMELGQRQHRPYESCGRISPILDGQIRTGVEINGLMPDDEEHLHRLQSSPGYLHVGHVPSKWTWQMPQTSSSGMSHRHVATVFHFLMVTFMVGVGWVR